MLLSLYIIVDQSLSLCRLNSWTLLYYVDIRGYCWGRKCLPSRIGFSLLKLCQRLNHAILFFIKCVMVYFIYLVSSVVYAV